MKRRESNETPLTAHARAVKDGEGESSETERDCETWAAQQGLGSLRLFQDRGEERLASPEVPGTEGLRMPDATVSTNKRRRWQLQRSLCTE